VSASRLTIAIAGGDIALPDTGQIAVFGPRVGYDLSVLPKDRVVVVTGFYPDYAHFEGQGFACTVIPEGRFSAAILCLPRAKPLARALLAQAAGSSDLVIVDGAKTDGIESILKELRKRVEVSAPLSKAHGKVFSLSGSDAFADWAAVSSSITDGFVTAPGVFSADGVDPGSAMLAAHLPKKLGAQVADLGGGWGYLSRAVLERDSIETLYLVEADHAALDCARQNITDSRVQFHWADATHWETPALLDVVVMNPPFHTGRAADPSLGRAFVQAAAKLLKPSGQLWMVANRHLPYEVTIAQAFVQSEEIAGDAKFKILCGTRPATKRR